MTENNTAEVWGEVGTPTDLWRAGKALSPMTPEETADAWRETVAALDGLGRMAEGVNLEPLLLALVDCKGRCDEELSRATDALERPEGGELHPREWERLEALLTRSDALNNAYAHVAQNPPPSARALSEMLEVLGELGEEAAHNLEVYRRELWRS